MGSTWVTAAASRLDHVGGPSTERRVEELRGGAWPYKPSDIFRQQIWVSPFPEDDIPPLVELIGADHSSWDRTPPRRGDAEARRLRGNSLKGLDDATIRRIIRDNALELLT